MKVHEDLFDTPQKREAAIADFENLIHHPGWKLLELIQLANIEFAREQLENGSDDETKEDIDLIRLKIKIFREQIEMPKKMIEKLQPDSKKQPSYDPYE